MEAAKKSYKCSNKNIITNNYVPDNELGNIKTQLFSDNNKSNLSKTKNMVTKDFVEYKNPTSATFQRNTNNNITSDAFCKNSFQRKNLVKLSSVEKKRPHKPISSSLLKAKLPNCCSKQKILSPTPFPQRRIETPVSSIMYGTDCSSEGMSSPDSDDILEICVNEPLSDCESSIKKPIQFTETKKVPVNTDRTVNKKIENNSRCKSINYDLQKECASPTEFYPTSENASIGEFDYIDSAGTPSSESLSSDYDSDDENKEGSFKRHHQGTTDSVTSTSTSKLYDFESENTSASISCRSSPVSDIISLGNKNKKSFKKNLPTHESIPVKVIQLETDLLQTIENCSSAEDLNDIFDTVVENMQHFHPTSKTTVIIKLLSLTLQYIDESNNHLLLEVLTLISEHHLENSKLCSLCITLCEYKSNLALPFVVNMFKLCKSIGIILENSANHALLDIFVREECDIVLLIDFWEYVQVDCSKSLDLSFINYIIHFCGANDVPEKLLLQVIRLVKLMEIRCLHFNSLGSFLNKLQEQQKKDIISNALILSKQSVTSQTPQQQLQMISKQMIIGMIESSSWHSLASAFKNAAVEKNMHVLKNIHEALFLQTSSFGECYQKLAAAVIDGSETLYEMHFLGQIGTVLMLEAYVKKDYAAAYAMLYTMHSVNIQFYELQIDSCKPGHLSISCFENSTSTCEVDRLSVVFAAVDVCVELGKHNSASTVINDFCWIRHSNDIKKNISKDAIIKQTNILLRLAVKSFSKKFHEVALELVKVLFPMIQNDLLLFDIKDMVTELTKVYNESLEVLINRGELTSALTYYRLSYDQKMNFLEVKDYILRGIVVSNAVAGLTSVAWSYFLHSVYRNVYSIPVQSDKKFLFIESSWTQVEIQFAIEFFLRKIFPSMLCKPLKTPFEKWFSVRILFKNSEEVSSLECLKVTSTTIEATLERTIYVLLSKIQPPLDIESFKNKSPNIIDIRPDSLYKKFCIWKEENPTEQSTASTNDLDVFTFQTTDTSFKFGAHDQHHLSPEKPDALSTKINFSDLIMAEQEMEVDTAEKLNTLSNERNLTNVAQNPSKRLLDPRVYSSSKKYELLNNLRKDMITSEIKRDMSLEVSEKVKIKFPANSSMPLPNVAVLKPYPRFKDSPLDNSYSCSADQGTHDIGYWKDSSDSCYFSECSPHISCGPPESWSSSLLSKVDEKWNLSDRVDAVLKDAPSACSPEIFKKIENFLKAKLLGTSKDPSLLSKAKTLAKTFISENGITSSLDRKSMKLLVDYAKTQVR